MNKPKGKLIAIGGNINMKISNADNILRRIVRETNIDSPRIEIIPTASGSPEKAAAEYRMAFRRLGSDARVLPIAGRRDAKNKNFLLSLEKADGIMFTGGNQRRLVRIFNNTEFLEILKSRYKEGNFLIAGTSAGAMAFPDVMIIGGRSAKGLQKGEVKMGLGFSFTQGLIIDSHFDKRGRFGRLISALAENPSLIGIGLSEDTGVIITSGYDLEVIGSGTVFIFDGHQIGRNYFSILRKGRLISVENIITHVLSAGDRYDL